MNKIFPMIALLSISSTAFAQTLLTCKGHTNEGDQVKEVVLTEGSHGPNIIWNGVSKGVVRVGESNVLSKKYVIQSSEKGDDIISLVANLKTKQAALIYEVDLKGQVSDPESNRYNVTVQFLDCK